MNPILRCAARQLHYKQYRTVQMDCMHFYRYHSAIDELDAVGSRSW